MCSAEVPHWLNGGGRILYRGRGGGRDVVEVEIEMEIEVERMQDDIKDDYHEGSKSES